MGYRMTPDEKNDALDVFEIAEKAFDDAIELLHLIEVMQRQNSSGINEKLTAANAGGAGKVVRNSVLSRIVLFVAGAYAPTRRGDLHIRRAFELLEQSAVRAELGLRGSPQLLDDAMKLWAQYVNDPRLGPIKHFRDKFTAHAGKPNAAIPIPPYSEVFGFARDTMVIMDTLARGTGAAPEPLANWQPQAVNAAKQFWHPWE